MKNDIVVLRGNYDSVERVLAASAIPYHLVNSLDEISLHPTQLLIINCPGNVTSRQIKKIQRFVKRGGHLITTDWALRNVLEQAFPGYVAWNQKTTSDEVVAIKITNSSHPFVAGIKTKKGGSRWRLETHSYPIKILDKRRVSVLIHSRELGTRYNQSAVAVLFKHGRGQVFHMISHFYLQRAEIEKVTGGVIDNTNVPEGANLTTENNDNDDATKFFYKEIQHELTSLLTDIIQNRKMPPPSDGCASKIIPTLVTAAVILGFIILFWGWGLVGLLTLLIIPLITYTLVGESAEVSGNLEQVLKGSIASPNAQFLYDSKVRQVINQGQKTILKQQTIIVILIIGMTLGTLGCYLTAKTFEEAREVLQKFIQLGATNIVLFSILYFGGKYFFSLDAKLKSWFNLAEKTIIAFIFGAASVLTSILLPPLLGETILSGPVMVVQLTMNIIVDAVLISYETVIPFCWQAVKIVGAGLWDWLGYKV